MCLSKILSTYNKAMQYTWINYIRYKSYQAEFESRENEKYFYSCCNYNYYTNDNTLLIPISYCREDKLQY